MCVTVNTLTSDFPEEFILCFHDAIAGIYDIWDPHTDLQEIPAESTALPLTLDRREGKFILREWQFPENVDASGAANLARVIQASSGLLELITGIYRRIASHPRSAGFIGVPSKQQDFSGTWAMAQTSSQALEKIAHIIPSMLWDGSHHWFPPGSDQNAFGQFYLTTNMDNDDVTWEIRQLGIKDAPVDTARWDDRAGLQRLWDYCVSNNPENLLTVKALGNPESVRAARNKHHFALAVRDAREAFDRKKDRLRPRLSELAVRQAAQQIQLPQQNGRQSMRVSLQLHDLVPYEIFGYHHQRDGLPAIYAAAEIVFFSYGSGSNLHGHDEQTLQESLVGALVPHLEERKLGDLQFINYGGKSHLWLAKNFNLVKANARAFGIPGDAEWR